MRSKNKHLTSVRLLGIIIGGVTLFMIPSLVTSIILAEVSMIRAFVIPIITGIVLTLSAVLFIRKDVHGIRPREGILLVFLTWIFSSLIGSIPYYLSQSGINIIDAIFESSCSFSTTGATTLSDVESLPRSLLLWRSTGHWAGGMGIILLTVALLPLLGVGGVQLIKAEVPDPEKEKLTPRITTAAKILWGAYCVFTLILVLLYRIGGMDWFDAVCHSFTVMSTGGVCTKNTGFGYYNSAFIDWVTVIFMLLGAFNFNMYYRIFQKKIRDVFQNTECRVYLSIFIIAALVISLNLIPQYGSFGDALRYGSFQTASILTSAGNARVDYSTWSSFAQAILFLLMFIGGCSGSTAGGIKVIRWSVLFKQTINEFRRILYPQGVFSIQLNKKVGRKDVVYGVAGYIFLYFIIIAITTLATAASGFDLFSSFSTAVSVMGNIGTGFGIIGPHNNYSVFQPHLKLLYSLVMIAGRLELWTVIVLFTPGYWKSL
jgi:trk system potassium uptake protein TrkH